MVQGGRAYAAGGEVPAARPPHGRLDEEVRPKER
jgi:hypothetical protein